ncbi:dystrotelin [Polymixia lowei]
MDLDSIEGLNEVRPSVYRVAMKLLSLQKLCYLHVVSLRQLLPALRSVGGEWNQEAGLSREEVTRVLNRMFHSVSQEVPGHVTLEAPAHTCSLIYKLYDQCGRSMEVALISLSADTLSEKHRALVCVAESSSRERGFISRSSLRSLLQDLSQVPAAVQEGGVFGSVDAAVRSCFSGVLTPCVSVDHVLSWLQSEPRLLLWLPTLYRLSVSQNVRHAVRCHACKTYPITGLRYRCMKCVSLHLCQTCFLTDRQTKKHKTSHPVLEHCTQPSWRESLASLVHSARHALLPRRYTRREAERRRDLMQGNSVVSQTSQPPPDSSPQLASPQPDRGPSQPDRGPSHDVAPPAPCPAPPRLQSRALQTEDPDFRRETSLLKDVKDLQRDKWLLEQQLQAWRGAVQSEQGILEDRCSEMEVTVETLRQHNLQLQDMITQALNRTETRQHADMRNETHTITPEPEGMTDSSGGEEGREEEESKLEFMKDEDTEEERGDEEREEEERGERKETASKSHSPTILCGITSPHNNQADCSEGEVSLVDNCLNEPMGQQYLFKGEGLGINKHLSNPIQQHAAEEVELQDDQHISCLLGEQYSDEEDCGTCSPAELEKKLLEIVESLRTALSLHTNTHTDRCTAARMKMDLLQAAEDVGDSVHTLVSSVTP